MRVAISVSAEVPQSPHDELTVPIRGSGIGASPPVSTVTTLYSDSAAGPWPQ